MKRFLTAVILAVCMVLPAICQDNSEEKSTPVWDHGDNVSSLTYHNVRIFKIYDQKDSYIVLYEKQSLAIGTAVIPKKWAKNDDGPRKLNFRTTGKGVTPYMTVISQDGEFLKVWITAPTSRFDSIWGITPSNYHPDGTDADTLEIEY